MTPVSTRLSQALGVTRGHVLLNGLTREVEIVALKRNLSVLLGSVVLAASLTACGTGGETSSGNAGKPTPTAVPTHADNSSQGVGDGGNNSDQGPAPGSGG